MQHLDTQLEAIAISWIVTNILTHRSINNSNPLKVYVMICNNHGKTLPTPNPNPTNTRHYFVDIQVLTIGKIPKYGFGVACWGPNDPISMKHTQYYTHWLKQLRSKQPWGNTSRHPEYEDTLTVGGPSCSKNTSRPNCQTFFSQFQWFRIGFHPNKSGFEFKIYPGWFLKKNDPFGWQLLQRGWAWNDYRRWFVLFAGRLFDRKDTYQLSNSAIETFQKWIKVGILNMKTMIPWMWPPPSGKLRFTGIPYRKCNNPGGHCYWEGATHKWYQQFCIHYECNLLNTDTLELSMTSQKHGIS